MAITRKHLAALRDLKATLERQLNDGYRVAVTRAGIVRLPLSETHRKRLRQMLAACRQEIKRLDE
jgi:hypothetical protein